MGGGEGRWARGEADEYIGAMAAQIKRDQSLEGAKPKRGYASTSF